MPPARHISCSTPRAASTVASHCKRVSCSPNSSLPANTMTNGSKKYPSDTGSARPCSGAHKKSHSCTPSNAALASSPRPHSGSWRARNSNACTWGHCPRSSSSAVVNGKVLRMRQPNTCSPSSGASQGASKYSAPNKKDAITEAARPLSTVDHTKKEKKARRTKPTATSE